VAGVLAVAGVGRVLGFGMGVGVLVVRVLVLHPSASFFLSVYPSPGGEGVKRHGLTPLRARRG
jgi:hypothetical protein